MDNVDYVVHIMIREGDREITLKYDNLEGPPTLEVSGSLFPKELKLFTDLLVKVEDFRKGRY